MQVEKTTEGFVRGTGGAPGQSFSAKSVAGEMSGRILLLFISHHPPLLFRPACCAVECKAELRPRGRRRASATPGRRGRHLPEVRGGARDQRFPSAGQVGEKLI